MMTQNSSSMEQRPSLSLGDIGRAILIWPRLTQLYVVALAVLFAPVLQQAANAWFHDENQAHGVFILPISLGLLWVRREELREVASRPVAWGLVPLGLGLALHLLTWLLQIQTQCFGIWALVLTLYGSVLILHGLALWQVVRFPVLFVMLAGGIPGKLIAPLSTKLQLISSTGATWLMKGLGFTLLQQGNMIEVPGCSLEVADVCSGLKKLLAMFAFSLVYGHVFDIAPWKRMALVVASVPIALLANIIRVAGLIAVSTYGGTNALHIAHDWAEIFVLVIAFLMFVGVGRVLGCKTLRFSL